MYHLLAYTQLTFGSWFRRERKS